MSDPNDYELDLELSDIVTATHELSKKRKITHLEPSDLLVQEYEKQQVIYNLEAEHSINSHHSESAWVCTIT